MQLEQPPKPGRYFFCLKRPSERDSMSPRFSAFPEELLAGLGGRYSTAANFQIP